MNAKEKVSGAQFGGEQGCAFVLIVETSSVFVHAGLKDWEKRLIISDRAHIGESSQVDPWPLLF